MPNSGNNNRGRRTSDKNRWSKKPGEQPCATFIGSVINGLDSFIVEANKMSLNPAVNILHGAKYDILYWAASRDLYQQAVDRSVNDNSEPCMIQKPDGIMLQGKESE